MFTGLVEATGEVAALEIGSGSARLTLRAPFAAEAQLGESVAVNGCCLTVVASTDQTISFDLLHETLARTSLRDAAPATLVNLERALAANARLGGHFVQGHVDCASEILVFEPHGADHRLEIALQPAFAQYVAFKGSIAIDGISLTVAEVHDESFVVWLIPHTVAVTNLRSRRRGDLVNLEFDLLAKYVERIVAARV
ncbi:MAG TPA: riboflavin synthase [Chthoniobacteraceae bacterium]|jgi:riboflavin synthase|nr:riboflavin synthase [Chthoniobacteraceae bacterium]